MNSGKSSWVIALRAAIDTVIDRIAWEAVQELIPEYEAVLKSTSWKITQPLRIIAKEVRSFIHSKYPL